ncbi:MAG: hypothetical protein IPO91_02555 [Chloroflexi bacterium]|nr:hypothetical protein [Chloroflexota bacterium]
MDVASQSTIRRRAAHRWQIVRASKSWQNGIRHAASYVILALGAAFMLFPMLWMISASLKPGWQIFTDPPIWIPQHWEEVRVGSTNRMLSLWRVEIDGQTEKVIEIGLRRYTTVVDAALLSNVIAAPTAELGEARSTAIGDLLLNVRDWTADGETRQVVALARGEDDTLIVAEVADIQAAALRLPLDEVNAGGRASPEIAGVEFRGREIETAEGVRQIIPIGPESQLTVVGSPEIAAAALLVPVEQLAEAGFAPVGQTELPQFTVEGQDGEFIVLVQESWQPVIDELEFDAYAFIAPRTQLTNEQTVLVNEVAMQGATFTADNVTTPVIVLVSGTQSSIVIPVSQATSLRAAQLGGLTSARGDQLNRIPFRVQDGFSDDNAARSVALVGNPRDLALIVPTTAVSEAFDVDPALSSPMRLRVCARRARASSSFCCWGR